VSSFYFVSPLFLAEQIVWKLPNVFLEEGGQLEAAKGGKVLLEDLGVVATGAAAGGVKLGGRA
jgi:hypothetical protein